MTYEVTLSENGKIIKETVREVQSIVDSDGSYRLINSEAETLFIAPQDSVVAICLS